LLRYNANGSVQTMQAVARRYGYIVLQAWDLAGLRAAKRANPHAVVLAYQEASAMTRGPATNGVSGSGVRYEEAVSHPEWFLKNRSGSPITERFYSFLYMADIGNRGYQQRWADNVARVLRSGPWDGVLMDDVNASAAFHVDPSQIARYPNDRAYQRAMRSFLAYVRPRIRATHKLEVANLGSWPDHPKVVRGWLRYLDGGMDEGFTKFDPRPGYGFRTRAQWDAQLGEVHDLQSRGKLFFGVSRADAGDVQGRLFGWGSMLLASSHHAGYLAATSYDAPPKPLGGAVLSVGAPRGGPRSAGPVVYRRFSHALVLVNPDPVPHGVRFRVQMSGTGLRGAKSATMGPHTALILHRTNSPRREPLAPIR
jgi:hypothetical protein